MAASKLNIPELLAQLPDTDLDIEARQKAEPGRLGQASKFTGPDPDTARRIFNAILAAGPEAVSDLIQAVRDPADPAFESFKPEYLLHALVVHVGQPGQHAAQEIVLKAIVSQLANPNLPSAVRAFLLRELPVTPNPAVTRALAQALSTPDLCDPAATTLAAIGQPGAEALRSALPQAQGRCRLVLFQNLGAVADTASLDAFIGALTDPDENIRLAAAWGAARVGGPETAPKLLAAADAADGLAQAKTTQACLLLAERLAAAGKKNDASRIYAHLLKTRTERTDQYLQEAARKALDQLGGSAPS